MDKTIEALDLLFSTLINLFLYDIQVFSQGWIYYWLMIPFLFYLMFFMVKWSVLTAPVWIPLTIIIRGFKDDNSVKQPPNDESKS